MKKEQVNTIVMEHFSRIVIQIFGPTNKQHTYQSVVYYKNAAFSINMNWIGQLTVEMYQAGVKCTF